MTIALIGGQMIAARFDTWWAPFLPFIMLEIVLWIDALVGYERIRLTNAVSHWFQRTVTTRVPTEAEISVGREALRKLLIAEGELKTNEEAA